MDTERLEQELELLRSGYPDLEYRLVETAYWVRFSLRDFDPERSAFVLREWRPMPPEAFEYQSAYHVTLRDEIRPEIIKWVWDADACLVEVHSHGDEGTASFSPSDLYGFDEWV